MLPEEQKVTKQFKKVTTLRTRRGWATTGILGYYHGATKRKQRLVEGAGQVVPFPEFVASLDTNHPLLHTLELPLAPQLKLPM